MSARIRLRPVFARVASFVLISWLIGSVAGAAERRWSPGGPLIGKLAILVADPDTPSRVYGAGIAGSLHVSSDGGRTWRWSARGMANEPVLSLAALLGGRLVAATEQGVYASEDDGETWRRLAGVEVFGPKPLAAPAGAAGFVAVAPSDPNRIYLTRENELWRSRDGGASWEKLADAERAYGGLVADPFDEDTFYLWLAPATTTVLEVGRDGGARFEVLSGTSGAGFAGGIQSILVEPTEPRQIYVSPWAALPLERSLDGGRTWSLVSLRGGNRMLLGPAPVRSASGDLYTTAFRSIHQLDPATGSWGPIAGGTTYELFDYAQLAVDAGEEQIYLSNAFGTGAIDLGTGAALPLWSPYGADLRFDPFDLRHWVATSLIESRDGGLGWSRTGVLAGAGQGTAAADVVFDPFRRNRLYAAGDPGLFRSDDGGRTWTAMSSRRSYGLAVLGPRTLLSAEVGLARSTNGGSSWRQVMGGTFFDADLGQTVTRLFVGFERDSRRSSVIYARALELWRQRPEPGFPLARRPAIYRSTDGGGSWKRLRAAHGFAIDPRRSTTLYATTFTLAGPEVLRSTDDGRSWRLLSRLPGLQSVTLFIDPVAPHDFYALQYDRGISRSTDGGVTWTLANEGLPRDRFGHDGIFPNALQFDPLVPHRVWVRLYWGWVVARWAL